MEWKSDFIKEIMGKNISGLFPYCFPPLLLLTLVPPTLLPLHLLSSCPPAFAPSYPCVLLPLCPPTLAPSRPCTLLPFWPHTIVPLHPCALTPFMPYEPPLSLPDHKSPVLSGPTLLILVTNNNYNKYQKVPDNLQISTNSHLVKRLLSELGLGQS